MLCGRQWIRRDVSHDPLRRFEEVVIALAVRAAVDTEEV